MKTDVRILELSDGWYLHILCYIPPDQITLNTLLEFNTLIDALDCATVLSIHVDNEDELPLTQYIKRAA